MDIAGEYTFDAPQDVVWEALQDPDVLGSVMPGGQGVEQIGENEYAGTLKIKVGPVQGLFKGSITLSDIVPPESYHLAVEGRGAPGFVKGSGGMKLTAQGDRTHMAYEGTAQIGGRIATLGQRLMESSARSILEQSLNSLNAYLQTQGAVDEAEEVPTPTDEGTTDADVSAPSVGESKPDSGAAPARANPRPSSPPESPPYEPPSTVGIGVQVAKDVTNDFLSPPYDPIALVVAFFLGILTCRFIRH